MNTIAGACLVWANAEILEYCYKKTDKDRYKALLGYLQLTGGNMCDIMETEMGA